MQFIFFLLGLFFIACVFYGVYAGVRTIVCSAAKILLSLPRKIH